MVLQTAPVTRITIAECFGEPPGNVSTNKLIGAAKAVGFTYVFDTNFAADLTIMEEGAEFLTRLEAGGPFPMFTSCCPAWVNLVCDFLLLCSAPLHMNPGCVCVCVCVLPE